MSHEDIAAQAVRAGIEAAREALRELRREPVAGRCRWLKRLLHKLHNSTFVQQCDVTERVIDVMERAAQAMNGRMEQTTMTGATPASEPARPLPAGVQQAIDASLGGVHAGLPGFSRVFNRYAQLRLPERVLLYSLVYALKPRCVLEIGTSFGGSTLILGGAMDDNGFGRLVCVDQAFRIEDEAWSWVAHRAVRVEGRSPDVLPQAASAAGGPFDFAFIDGDHTRDGLLRDIEGTRPHLALRAWLLFHDSHHPPVREAIDEALRRHATELADAGELSFEQTTVDVPTQGAKIWGGMRLVRYERKGNRDGH